MDHTVEARRQPVVDRLFDNAELAAFYDRLHPFDGRADFRFYLPLVMAARSVLDVGCGTGALLRRAREQGHTGRLVGLDPARGMLNQARSRQDVEWVLGDLASARWDHEFELVVMTGHAFQVFVDDEDIRVALAAIGAALTDAGRFVFETRNPLARGWEHWTRANVLETVDDEGVAVRMWSEVELPVEGEVVRFTTTFTSARWERPQISQSTLRFLDARSISRFLAASGMAIEEQFGDWGRQPLTARSPEIVTVARRDAASGA